MSDRHDITAKWPQWMGMLVLLVALLLASAVPGDAWRGPHRFGGVHRFGRPHFFFGPRIVIPFGPYWAPYGYPPVVVAPPPQVYVQPSPPVPAQPPPPSYWYYCANPPGYYPYVQQCPGGWLQVTPQPQ